MRYNWIFFLNCTRLRDGTVLRNFKFHFKRKFVIALAFIQLPILKLHKLHFKRFARLCVRDKFSHIFRLKSSKNYHRTVSLSTLPLWERRVNPNELICQILCNVVDEHLYQHLSYDNTFRVQQKLKCNFLESVACDWSQSTNPQI